MLLFMFHKDLAPDGKVFKSVEDVPANAGWVDTPEAFKEGYVPPAPLAPGEAPKPAPIPGHVHVAYPSHRFNAAGEDKVVPNAEEDALLDPAVWKHTPDRAAFGDAPAVPPAPLGAGTATAPPASPSDVHKAELYAANAATVVEKVATMQDIAMLQLIQGFELANPKTPRKTVLAAVVKRLTELGLPPAPEPVKA